MSWHASIIGVQPTTLSPVPLANSLGYINSTGVTDFESATSSMFDGAAFARCGDWIIGTHGMFWIEQGKIGDRLAEIEGITQAVAIISEGASGTYSYEFVNDGKLVRRIVAQEGEIIEEVGNKTPL